MKPKGSSPLTRGKPVTPGGESVEEGLIPAHAGKIRVEVASGLSQLGLIPAHAGKIPDSWAPASWARAHPRSRGENVKVSVVADTKKGSSPLTRGKCFDLFPRRVHGGLIPAHAGKIPSRSSARPGNAAHPRSRGENWALACPTLWTRGSSPLTRGKYFLTCAFIAQIGQILESLELCASSESYSLRNVYATDAPPDQVRSIGLVPLSSRGAS